MGCDMVVALGSATVQGGTLFAANHHGSIRACLPLQLAHGKAHALGETVCAQYVELPQTRQTYSVLACRSLASWGYVHGINEHQVAAGCASWQSRIAKKEHSLTGPDLVRLVLERSRTACQALELLTDLVARFGQGGASGEESDHIFLVADCQEAFVVEAAGAAWASLECRDVRAVSDIGLARQDWLRLAPGLADRAITQGWWPDDGSKLDFAGSLSRQPLGHESALRRWGRATLLLEHQNGHIDAPFLRKLLADHYEGTHFEVDPLAVDDGPKPLCRHASLSDPTATTASMIASLSPAQADSVSLAWCAFGAPCASVYVPIFLDALLPEAFSGGGRFPQPDSLWWRTRLLEDLAETEPERWFALRHNLAQLQARFDQETEEFLPEARALKQKGDREGLRRQTSLFMENHLEQLDTEYRRLQSHMDRRPVFSHVE